MLRIEEQQPVLEVSTINEIHKEEATLITELYSAAKENQMRTTLELLNRLIEHTTQHFSSEEKLMQDLEYPDYHSHKHEHMMQLLDIKSILSFYEMTNDTQSIHKYLEDTLTPWIIAHVQNWDIPASEFIAQ